MNNDKEKIALNSVGASLFLTLFKLIVGISTGSIGIISEAIHSGLDFAAAFITLIAVKISGKPADLTHHYGYGKVESVSAFIETLLLLITSVWIIYEAVQRLIFKTVEVEVTWYAFVVMIISIAVDYSRSRALYKVARETNSQALEADALHFKTDIYNSLVVLSGLVLLSFGVRIADSLAAIGVSVLVLHAAYDLGKRTIYVLIDRAPVELTDKVKQVVKNTKEVVEIELIRVRPMGPTFHVELSVGISRTIPLQQSHNITDLLESKIKKRIPGADVIVHVKPVALDEENIIERIQILAANKGYPVHNIKVHSKDGKKYVGLDLEVNEELSLSQAHEVCYKIEKTLENDLGDNTEVNIHIEPVKLSEIESQDISAKETENIQRAIDSLKKTIKEVKDLHKVVVHNSEGRIVVSLHTELDKNTSLEEAHKISEKIEELLKKKFKNIERVIVHTEPRK